MPGNNKQETIARINELTNEAEKLHRKIFKLRTFVESTNCKKLTADEGTYIKACWLQLDNMESYYENLQERAIQLQGTLEK